MRYRLTNRRDLSRIPHVEKLLPVVLAVARIPDGGRHLRVVRTTLMASRAAGCKPVAMFFADNQGGKLSALLADEARREKLAASIASASWEFEGTTASRASAAPKPPQSSLPGRPGTYP